MCPLPSQLVSSFRPTAAPLLPLKLQIEESQIIRMLEEVAEQLSGSTAAKKVTITRRKQVDDDDNDDDL